MAQLLLPRGHTEDDRRLAERIAMALKSKELVVCQPAARPLEQRPALPPPRQAEPSHQSLGLVGELAVAFAVMWDALRQAYPQVTDRRGRSPR